MLNKLTGACHPMCHNAAPAAISVVWATTARSVPLVPTDSGPMEVGASDSDVNCEFSCEIDSDESASTLHHCF